MGHMGNDEDDDKSSEQDIIEDLINDFSAKPQKSEK